MNLKLVKVGDILVDKQGQIKEYTGSCNIKEKRDGNDFQYPGCVLKDVLTQEVMVVPQGQLDLDFMLVHPEVCGFDINDPKAAEIYLKAFESAMAGNYHKDYASKYEGMYQKLVASTHHIVNSYAGMNMTNQMPPKTQELLQNFALFILTLVDIAAFKHKQENSKE